MADDGSQFPRIPPRLGVAQAATNWLAELNRRVAATTSNLLDRMENVEVRQTTSFQGTYDQVNDLTAPQGVALDAASNYQPGDFYTLSASGTFSTSIPELSGLTGGAGDQVISDGTVWVLLAQSSDFISSVIDDQAAGVITFLQPPIGTQAAANANEYIRKGESDGADGIITGNLNAHVADTASADDVHGTKTYTDNAIAAHDDPLVHFDDVPIDGIAYSRQDRLWTPAPTFPSFAYLAGGTMSGAWNTTLKDITGYSDSDSTLDMAGQLNPAAGWIEFPEAGLWEVQATLVGDQGNDTKEEAMRLWLRVTNSATPADAVLDVFDVATDKTSDRAFAFSFKRAFSPGERVSLAVNATSDMGTFSFEISSLEVTRII